MNQKFIIVDDFYEIAHKTLKDFHQEGNFLQTEFGEEIVGEIKDEHDFEEIEEIKKISKKTYDVSARLPVEDLEKKIGGYFSDEEKEDIDTVGGLVFNLLGKIPSRGEVINHKSGLEFTIRDADTRKIKRILVNVK